MKRIILMAVLTIGIALIFSSCGTDYAGTYTGYSWKGESKGVTLEDAVQKIETTLVLDKKGIIVDASVNFMKKNKSGDGWYNRNTPVATVAVDFNVTPSIAVPQSENQDYTAGASMFTIKTNDKMSFYAVAVDSSSTVAFGLVDPMHRYLSELKLESEFDYSKPLSDLTIANGLLVPTIRTSGSGYLKPSNWDEYKDTHIFGFYKSTYVYTGRGIFDGLTPESSVQELLEKAGVKFDNGRPQPMETAYGFYASGGWTGNYLAIADFLKGKDATKLTSLVDWSADRYSGSVNDENFFGVDNVSGATRTVQNSTDGISGATVRMSRESTSYQRALVASEIIKEENVVKGRF